jgi:hypothetical protein
MANEMKYTYAASVALEASGASAATAAFVAANDAALSSANHSDYPYADFVLKTVGFGGALASTGSPAIALYRQDLNVGADANNDAPAPSANIKSMFVGNFVLPLSLASTGTNYFVITDVPLSSGCQFSIENQAGQSVAEGWALTAVPKSFVPGA